MALLPLRRTNAAAQAADEQEQAYEQEPQQAPARQVQTRQAPMRQTPARQAPVRQAPVQQVQQVQTRQAPGAVRPGAPGRPQPRPTGAPQRQPVRPQPRQSQVPERRGDFLRGVVPGQDRLDPHFKVSGRYVVSLELVELFRNRDNTGDVFRAELCVVAHLSEDCNKRIGDRFNLLFTTKNYDVYKSETAKLVIGFCKPTDEELAIDQELPDDEQTLLLDCLDGLLDGDLNGTMYDVGFTPDVTSKGKEVTRIHYGDVYDAQMVAELG